MATRPSGRELPPTADVIGDERSGRIPDTGPTVVRALSLMVLGGAAMALRQHARPMHTMACAGGLLTLGALLLSCGGSGGAEPDGQLPAPADGGAPVAEFDPPSREEFVRGGLRSPGTDRATLRRTLAQPDSVHADAVPNRHLPGVVDTLLTVYYPGLIAHIHRTGPGRELLSTVEVTTNAYLRYPAVGVDTATIVATLGEPDERSADTLTYHCTTCIAGEDPVQLITADGRVGRVRFNYYVD